MKILLDFSRVSTGGAIQNSLAVIHNVERERGHEWHAIVSPGLSRQLPSTVDWAFASIRRLDSWGPLRTRYLAQLAMPKWERAISPDVCFSPAGPVYWRSRAPQVVAFALPHLIYPDAEIYRNLGLRDRLRLRVLLRAARRSFIQADNLVAQTETVRSRASRLLPFPRERIFLVKNSYSPTFAGRLSQAPPRAPSDKFLVLVPSAYYAHKNLESVVDVAREARSQGLRDVEFRLTLPTGSVGWRRIQAGAVNQGVADLITTRGNVPHAELAAEYKLADLIFLPSLLECSTAVYPESFIAGIPLVTSDVDFARELCGDGARFVNPHDPAAMANAIVDLARNEHARNRLIESGRRALETSYITPEDKWRAQLTCITTCAGST